MNDDEMRFWSFIRARKGRSRPAFWSRGPTSRMTSVRGTWVDGTRFEYVMQPEDSLGQLKERLGRSNGLPRSAINACIMGEVLDDRATLGEHTSKIGRASCRERV